MFMRQWTKQFGFPAEPSDLFLPAQMDDFDGDLAMQLVIKSQVHFCHSSPSQQVREAVTAQDCSFQCRHSWLLLPPCIETIVEDKVTPRQETAPSGGQMETLVHAGPTGCATRLHNCTRETSGTDKQ